MKFCHIEVYKVTSITRQPNLLLLFAVCPLTYSTGVECLEEKPLVFTRINIMDTLLRLNNEISNPFFINTLASKSKLNKIDETICQPQ